MKRLSIAIAMLLAAGSAHADITRTEVLDRAKAYVFYPFETTTANQTASCVGDYQSAYLPGDHMGVAYDWGGWASLFDFDQKLGDGYGAGSPAFGDVYWCTVGVDCSGFVSQAWQTNQKYATISIPEISSAIDVGDLLVGDVFNKTSFHVAMFIDTLANGEPLMYEAVGYNTHVNSTGGWSYVSEFTARRFESITGTSASSESGTLNTPVPVTSFPFTDSRSTGDSLSDLLDGCGEQPGSNESGPEVVYEVEISEPGTLTVAVSDDAGTDIDVHLYETWNTETCVARNDSSFSEQVDCGTYYVVADTFGGESNAGSYDLTVSFTPSSAGSCGAGPTSFDPSGGLGDSCSYPDDPNLGFCNPTLGGDICLYSTGSGSTSFCTTACASNGDCGGLGAGSCCADIGEGELYCLTADFCGEEEEPGDEGGGGDGGDGDGDGDGDGGGGVPGPGPDGDGGGGGCRAAGHSGGGSTLAVAFVLLGALLRRRRR